MSRTEMRNGERVFKAAVEIAKQREGFAHGMVMVGEVAAAAGVSSPTARKYLDICVNGKIMEVANMGGALIVFKFVNPEEL